MTWTTEMSLSTIPSKIVLLFGRVKDIEEIVEIKYLQGPQRGPKGSRYIQSIRCRKCLDFLFKDGGQAMIPGDLSGLVKQLKLHFMLNHDIDIVFNDCSNPNCLKKH